MTNTTTNNLFEIAVRNQYRFNFKGSISVEDLYQLSVQELDLVFKALSKELKANDEESLLNTKTSADTVLENKIAIVKHIVAVKLAEEEERKNAQANKAEQQRLLELIAKKQNEALENLSEEELQQRLAAIQAGLK